MAFPLYVVDAFTDRPFSGNPAAVCLLLSHWPNDIWLQGVAREMNLSETAFLVNRGKEFELRWFTPTVEVDLCGHATLASAHVLWENGVSSEDVLRFHTRSGILEAKRKGKLIELEFPLFVDEASAAPEGLNEALGTSPRYVGKTRFDYLLELGSEEELINLTPDFSALAKVNARGVIVTAPSKSSEFDFVSRFFGPAVGVNEDPVTGSSHCSLASFWQKRLGKNQFTAYQASSRGGVVHLEVVGERVKLAGHAVTMTRGELLA